MEIRHVTPQYAVSAQIEPGDCAGLAEAGFKTIICNRPDAEAPPHLQSDQIKAAAEAAGLSFVDNPVHGMSLTPESIALQADVVLKAPGPVFAYCRSGTRSVIIWAFATAREMPPEQIIKAAANAGHDLSGMASQLEMLSKP